MVVAKYPVGGEAQSVENKSDQPGRNVTARRIAERFSELDDLTRGTIYVVLALTVIGMIIVGITYRASLAIALAWLAGILTIGSVCAGIVLHFRRSAAKKREKKALEWRLAWDETERLQRELAERLKTISEGRSEPILDTGGFFLKNSEIAWYRCGGSVERKDELHHGNLVVTSLRVVFVSPTAPADIPIVNINAATFEAQRLTIVGKTASNTMDIYVSEPEIAKAHIERSVLTFNRQKDVGFEPRGSRTIPQEVKTVVHQRDQGRCVECGADDYLEYDHVIPFSKGGASTVDNVQILCRRCNLKKRDRI